METTCVMVSTITFFALVALTIYWIVKGRKHPKRDGLLKTLIPQQEEALEFKKAILTTDGSSIPYSGGLLITYTMLLFHGSYLDKEQILRISLKEINGIKTGDQGLTVTTIYNKQYKFRMKNADQHDILIAMT
tara:strand:- start:767 stop:1165 length:399 start_codon:yes stop_codon:yes gene_type:complete